jgi:hypothetical protein
MPNVDHRLEPRPRTGRSRRGFAAAALVGGLVVAVTVIAVAMRSDPEATGSPSAPRSSPAAEATTTTIGEREEVVGQLRAILRVRDKAYRERDINLLQGIYTGDCPCLRGDRGGIQQLLKDNAVWVGASTSVEVRDVEKVNDKLWIIVADFVGSPFRIETESGDLIRAVEGRRELFRFAVSRATSDKLLLGFAGPVNESE